MKATLFCLKKNLFSRNHAWNITKRGWNNYSIWYKLQSCNQGTSPFCHVLCLEMHTNVMLRFMVQALQDPPLCSSTSCTFIANHFLYIKLIIMRCCSSPSPFRAESFYLIGLLTAQRQCKIILWVNFSRVLRQYIQYSKRQMSHRWISLSIIKRASCSIYCIYIFAQSYIRIQIPSQHHHHFNNKNSVFWKFISILLVCFS